VFRGGLGDEQEPFGVEVGNDPDRQIRDAARKDSEVGERLTPL